MSEFDVVQELHASGQASHATSYAEACRDGLWSYETTLIGETLNKLHSFHKRKGAINVSRISNLTEMASLNSGETSTNEDGSPIRKKTPRERQILQASIRTYDSPRALKKCLSVGTCFLLNEGCAEPYLPLKPGLRSKHTTKQLYTTHDLPV